MRISQYVNPTRASPIILPTETSYAIPVLLCVDINYFLVLKEDLDIILNTIERDVPNVLWSVMVVGDLTHNDPIQITPFVTKEKLPYYVSKIHNSDCYPSNNSDNTSYTAAWFMYAERLHNPTVNLTPVIITIGSGILNYSLPKANLYRAIGGNRPQSQCLSFSYYKKVSQIADIYHISVDVEDRYGVKEYFKFTLKEYPERLKEELERVEDLDKQCPYYDLRQKVKDTFGTVIGDHLLFSSKERLAENIINIISLYSQNNRWVSNPAKDNLKWIRYRYIPSGSYIEKLYSGYAKH